MKTAWATNVVPLKPPRGMRRRGRRTATPQDWQPEPPRTEAFYIEYSSDCLVRTAELAHLWLEEAMGPQDIVPVLQRERIEYVLLGLYGISGWLKEPRATEDVDVLVPQRKVKRAVAAICRAFPHLKPKDTPVVVRLFQDDRAVADVMKAHHPLFVEALKDATDSTMFGVKVRVPSLEAALSLKFFSMTSLGRQEKDKYQDAHDFINMVEHNRTINEAKLRTFGELAYAGGGDDLVRMVADARAGRKLEI